MGKEGGDREGGVIGERGRGVSWGKGRENS